MKENIRSFRLLGFVECLSKLPNNHRFWVQFYTDSEWKLL